MNLIRSILWPAALVLLLAACQPRESDKAKTVAEELATANSGMIDPATLKGKWVVVNFWAEWCAPCRKEIPELNELDREPGIQVLGVDFDRHEGDELTGIIEKMGIQFPVLFDGQVGDLRLPWPSVLPVTYLIHDGNLVETLQGPQTQQGLIEKTASH